MFLIFRHRAHKGSWRRGGVLLLALALWGGLIAPVHAASQSRVWGTTLFVVGVGLKMGGVIAGNEARATYDDYLLTAVQDEIQRLRNDYRSKIRLSQGLSNTGAGFMVAGALWTVYATLRQDAAATPKVSLSSGVRRGEFVMLWNRSF